MIVDKKQKGHWFVCVNGHFFDERNPVLPVTDRGFLFGEGTFTTIRVCDGKIEFLKEHLQRLKSHCRRLKIPWPSFNKKWVYELISQNKAYKGVWRLKIVVTGSLRLILLLTKETRRQAPVTLGISPWPIVRPSAQTKTLAYIDRLLTQKEAEKRGVDDLIVTTPDGILLEATFSNIFWVLGKHLYTPDFQLPLLKGITIQHIIKKVKDLGFKVHKVKAKLDDIPKDAQIFICNSIMHFQPVVKIENQRFKRDLKFEKILILN